MQNDGEPDDVHDDGNNDDDDAATVAVWVFI